MVKATRAFWFLSLRHREPRCPEDRYCRRARAWLRSLSAVVPLSFRLLGFRICPESRVCPVPRAPISATLTSCATHPYSGPMAQHVRVTFGVLVAAAASLSGGLGYAAEWTVDQGAAPAGDGSTSKPFTSINGVMDVIQTGDTVWIRNGTYHETLNFYHLSGAYDEAHRTTISAAPGATSVIIDGDNTSNEYIVQAATPYMTFRGLTVRNGSGEAFQFYGCEPGSCGASDMPADYGVVDSCVTQNVASGVVFYFTGHGQVINSDIFGGISGKGSDGTILSGNRVHGSSVEGVALHDDSKNCKYLNNTIYDNQRPNIYLDSASYMTVDGNVIYMSGDPPQDNAGIQMADEKYAELTGPVLSNITITNNVIFNNMDGIYFWDSGMWNGQSGMKNVTIANNTIVNNKNRGLYWDAGAHQNVIIRNNIVVQGAGVGNLLIDARATTNISLDHNLWYMPGVSAPFAWGGSTSSHDSWASAAGQGAGDVVADPLFVGSWALPAADFMLTQSSPAIDRGISGIPLPTGDATLNHDFALAARPAGQGYDLGAFEFGAAPAALDAGNPALNNNPSDTGSGGSSNASNATGGASSGTNSGSCGCRMPARQANHAWLLALLAVAMRRRKRR